MPFVDDKPQPLDPRIARSMLQLHSLVHAYAGALHALIAVVNRMPAIDGFDPPVEIRAALEEVQRSLPALPPRATDADALGHLQNMLTQLDEAGGVPTTRMN